MRDFFAQECERGRTDQIGCNIAFVSVGNLRSRIILRAHRKPAHDLSGQQIQIIAAGGGHTHRFCIWQHSQIGIPIGLQSLRPDKIHLV